MNIGLKELASVFLRLGAMSYGGSAMLGIMQAEIAERRQWLTNEQYLEGVGFVSLLPGPPAVQLSIYIGYIRCGWKGGVLAGFCFMLPAFLILLGLTLIYATYGAIASVQGALYGMGIVVLAIFASAVFRLGKTALKQPFHLAIAIVAALLAYATSGVATLLALAACAGVIRSYSRPRGLMAALVVIALAALGHFAFPIMEAAGVSGAAAASSLVTPTIPQLAGTFAKIGALTFGGGLAMLALVQEQVVNQLHWLSSREFLDGLSLGQLTPGPTLMISAYVGFKVSGVAGAVICVLAMFLPAFIMMLAAMPVMERFRHLQWVKPALNGVSAAIIGCLVVTLLQLAPHAVSGAGSIAVLLIAAAILCRWKLPPFQLIVAAGLIGSVIHAG